MNMEGKSKGIVAALLATVVVVTAGLLYWQQARLQSVVASNRLDTARAVQALVEKQIATDLDARAQLIAGNQAFVGYVTQAMGGILPGTLADTASVVDLLDERRAQLGLTLAALIDDQGQLIASRDGISERRDFTREPLFGEAVNTISTTRGLWVDQNRVFQVTILPLAGYGSDAGFLLVGAPLDDATLRAIAEAAQVEVALVASSPSGPAVAASTLDPTQSAELLAALPDATGAAANQDFTVRLQGTRYRAYVAPLSGSSTARLAVLAPVGSGVASVASTGLPMIIGLLLGLALLVAAALFARASVTKQVNEMTRIVKRAASSADYHLRATETGLLAPLGAAFNQLMGRLRGDEVE